MRLWEVTMNSNIDNMVKYIQGHLSKYDWPLKDGLIEEKIDRKSVV